MTKQTKTITLLASLALTVPACFESGEPRDMDEMDETDGDTGEPDADDDEDMDDDQGTDGGDDDGGDDGDPIEPEPGNALIRVIHGAPDAGEVDIYVEGSDEPAIAGLEYGETSAWLEVPEGEYNFLVRPAGASPLDTPVYETGDLTLSDGAVVSALAAGLLDTMGNNGFRVIPLIGGFEEAGPGQARVRIVHAGSDAPAVDLDVGNDESYEIENLNRFTETGAAGVELPAGEALQIGVGVDGENVTAFTTPELEEGSHVIVIATGLLGRLPRENDGFGLLAVGDEGTIGFIRQNPTVYGLHAGPDAPAEVDICTGDTRLYSHLTFGTIQGVQVPPGSYELDAYAAPSGCAGNPATSRTTPDLEAGESYLVVATGELSQAEAEPPLQLVTLAEDFSLDAPDFATVKVLHAASAPDVDVGIVTGGLIEDGNVLAEGLKWPGESDELQVPPLTYQVGLAAAGGSLPLHPVADFHVPVQARLPRLGHRRGRPDPRNHRNAARARGGRHLDHPVDRRSPVGELATLGRGSREAPRRAVGSPGLGRVAGASRRFVFYFRTISSPKKQWGVAKPGHAPICCILRW